MTLLSLESSSPRLEEHMMLLRLESSPNIPKLEEHMILQRLESSRGTEARTISRYPMPDQPIGHLGHC